MWHFGRLPGGGHNFWVLNALDCITVPAVNIFILITGYYSCLSNIRKIGKPLALLFQFALWKLVFGLFSEICIYPSNETLLMIKREVTRLLTPDYFITLYIALYIFSPYLNRTITGLSEKSFRKLLIYMFVIFSLWASMMDIGNEVLHSSFFNNGNPVGAGGSVGGSTVVHFMFMYLLGAYLRLFPLNISVKKCTIGLLIVVVSLMLFRVTELQMFHNNLLMNVRSYCNPLVIIQSVILFVIFSRINLKSIIVNQLSGAAFTCYMIQGPILKLVEIPLAVNGGVFIMCIHIVTCLVGIYLLSYIAYKLYIIMFGSLFDKISYQIKY